MFELLYQQAYTLQWKHLAALLEMFNPQTRRSPTEKVLKELIDEAYVFTIRKSRDFVCLRTGRS